MAVGSNLKYNGKRTLNSLVFTQFEPSVKADGANSDNVVTFTVTPAEGRKFAPSKISFLTSRIGTDGGAIDIEWTNAAGITTIETGITPTRNNATPPYLNYSKDIVGIAPAEGSQTLSLYIYNLNTGKQVALHNVSITGYIEADATGIREMITAPAAAATFNLSGQRTGKGYKGIVIESGKKLVRK
jgi:hypothetical protein